MKKYAKWVEDIPCWLRITSQKYPWNYELDQSIKWDEIDDQLVKLREEDQLTYHEIASRLRVSLYSVHKRYLELLRTRLDLQASK